MFTVLNVEQDECFFDAEYLQKWGSEYVLSGMEEQAILCGLGLGREPWGVPERYGQETGPTQIVRLNIFLAASSQWKFKQ